MTNQHADFSGLQVVPDQQGLHYAPDHGGMQVAPEHKAIYAIGDHNEADWAKVCSGSPYDSVSSEMKIALDAPTERSPKSMPPWRKKRVLVLIVALVLILAIAIPVAAVFSRRNDNSSQTSSDGPLPSSQPSSQPNRTDNSAEPGTLRSDALLGTRLSVMDPSGDGTLFLFYQNSEGNLRYAEMASSRVWQGSRDLPISDARNNTPLASSWWVANGNVYWSVFYIDRNNILQDYWSRSVNDVWHHGDLGDMQLEVPSDESVSLAASPGRNLDMDTGEMRPGATLAVCQEGRGLVTLPFSGYMVRPGLPAWSNALPAVTASCGSAAAAMNNNGTQYLYSVQEQTVEMWYYDEVYDADGSYHQGSSGPFAAASPASVCADDQALVYLAPDNSIRGWNFTYSIDGRASRTRWNREYEISGGDDILEGTAVGCWRYDPNDMDSVRHVFYQLRNGTIQAAVGYPGEPDSSVPVRWEYSYVNAL